MQETYFCLMKAAPLLNISYLPYSPSTWKPSGRRINFHLLLFFILLLGNSLSSRAQSDSTKYKETSSIDTSQPAREPIQVEVGTDVQLSRVTRLKRQWLVGGLSAVGYGGSLLLLNNTWYKNYAHTSFQTFNDSREWLQVDKVGHAWTAYNTGMATTAMWEWAGVKHKQAVWIGGLSGFAFLTGIEFLDAHSAKWGWSWSDIAANVTGSALFMGQEFLWEEQRIQYKFSFHRNKYNEPLLEDRANDLFGNSWYERMLKDYNAQTYWLSANIKSFFPDTGLPPWLNIAVGYGASGMFGGFQNQWVDKLGNSISREDIPRTRQFYLAPDIDFTKIRTSSRFLRTALSFLNSFKFPSPALMIDGKGKWKGYLLYF